MGACKIHQVYLGILVLCLALLWPFTALQAVEIPFKINVKPTPAWGAQRESRLQTKIDELNFKARQHIPHVSVLEQPDRLVIEAFVDSHSQQVDHYIRGFLLYVNRVVKAKVMFTPENSKPHFVFILFKNELVDGDEISVISDCTVDEYASYDFLYHGSKNGNNVAGEKQY